MAGEWWNVEGAKASAEEARRTAAAAACADMVRGIVSVVLILESLLYPLVSTSPLLLHMMKDMSKYM
jgi:hypothetical protein